MHNASDSSKTKASHQKQFSNLTDLSVEYEAPAAANIMLWDPTPVGVAMQLNSTDLFQPRSIKLSTSAFDTLKDYLDRICVNQDEVMIGFLVSVSHSSNSEFDVFDKGLCSDNLQKIPTCGRGLAIPVYSVNSSEANLISQLRNTSRSKHVFIYNRGLVKLSYYFLFPRSILTAHPINDLRLVENSVSSRVLINGSRFPFEFGWIAINKARRAYLLKREATSLKIAGLWISGCSSLTGFDANVLELCHKFLESPISKITQSQYLLCLFSKTSAAFRFYQWHLKSLGHHTAVADLRPGKELWIESPLTFTSDESLPSHSTTSIPFLSPSLPSTSIPLLSPSLPSASIPPAVPGPTTTHVPNDLTHLLTSVLHHLQEFHPFITKCFTPVETKEVGVNTEVSETLCSVGVNTDVLSSTIDMEQKDPAVCKAIQTIYAHVGSCEDRFYVAPFTKEVSSDDVQTATPTDSNVSYVTSTHSCSPRLSPCSTSSSSTPLAITHPSELSHHESAFHESSISTSSSTSLRVHHVSTPIPYPPSSTTTPTSVPSSCSFVASSPASTSLSGSPSPITWEPSPFPPKSVESPVSIHLSSTKHVSMTQKTRKVEDEDDGEPVFDHEDDDGEEEEEEEVEFSLASLNYLKKHRLL
ncbi:hypothetical protein HMI54_003803 [Coelomomyces lativittatus]|nr:hypothetical protein HMI56_001246 [Coelomomyces lativittatus]KAJ1507828.1 hypothetical protein HMI54_003803 [Coelomomyces lativittatus]